MNRDTEDLLLKLLSLLRSERVEIAVGHKPECPALDEFLKKGINRRVVFGEIKRRIPCTCGAGVLEDERDRILQRLGVKL